MTGIKNKQTAMDWLLIQLWDTPRDKFSWNYYLAEAKKKEESNIINQRFIGFCIGLLSAITGILLAQFI